ncbi:MAG: hypothetical protein J5806_10800 [Lentisphaeria bacterium]|nr:hypothetical protein [Lentisphaeria bacterium]
MGFHKAPDTNLIQEGVEVSKKRNEKYLKQDAAGIWHLNFRVPVRFGGKLIRQSLFTEDFDVAVSIRDRFVIPILALNSGVAALEEIGKSIIAAEGDRLIGKKNVFNYVLPEDWIALQKLYKERYINGK